jgi:uncharacterized protein
VPTVIVLAKQPVAGRVKTRLCPPCTQEQAAELAAAALKDTFAAVSGSRADRLVAVFDGDPSSVVPASYEVIRQRTGSLDIRLADAFDDVFCDNSMFDEEEVGAVILIAMDTPQVSSALLDQAIDALADDDAVIGMTEDGGYWIIGLNEANREVFEGVPMSQWNTGVAQLERLESLGLSVAMLPELRDLDLPGDVKWLSSAYPRLHTSKVWDSFDFSGHPQLGLFDE